MFSALFSLCKFNECLKASNVNRSYVMEFDSPFVERLQSKIYRHIELFIFGMFFVFYFLFHFFSVHFSPFLVFCLEIYFYAIVFNLQFLPTQPIWWSVIDAMSRWAVAVVRAREKLKIFVKFSIWEIIIINYLAKIKADTDDVVVCCCFFFRLWSKNVKTFLSFNVVHTNYLHCRRQWLIC